MCFIATMYSMTFKKMMSIHIIFLYFLEVLVGGPPCIWVGSMLFHTLLLQKSHHIKCRMEPSSIWLDFLFVDLLFQQCSNLIYLPLPMTTRKIIPNHLATKKVLFKNGHIVVPRQKIPTPCRLELPTTTITPYNMMF
jgi:hypothetical protein